MGASTEVGRGCIFMLDGASDRHQHRGVRTTCGISPIPLIFKCRYALVLVCVVGLREFDLLEKLGPSSALVTIFQKWMINDGGVYGNSTGR
jgi:hypothetical protein